MHTKKFTEEKDRGNLDLTNQDYPQVICWNCDKLGNHIMRDCPEPRRPRTPLRRNNRNQSRFGYDITSRSDEYSSNQERGETDKNRGYDNNNERNNNQMGEPSYNNNQMMRNNNQIQYNYQPNNPNYRYNSNRGRRNYSNRGRDYYKNNNRNQGGSMRDNRYNGDNGGRTIVHKIKVMVSFTLEMLTRLNLSMYSEQT